MGFWLNIDSFSVWLHKQENSKDNNLEIDTKNYIKYINEQAKAAEGDLEDYRVDDEDIDKKITKYEALRIITPTALRTQWKHYGYITDRNNTTFDVYNMGTSRFIVVIKGKDKDYLIITEATLQDEPTFKSKFKLNNAYRVYEIISIPNYRGLGIGMNLYKLWVNNGLNIFGDFEQFFGARKLWSKISKESDVTVDIVDITKGEYIENNTVVHHGDFDHEFDDRVWSRGNEKYNIRLLLRHIN